MSTRTPIGGQPRPPQRTLSASSLSSIQRPSQQQQHRTLSQQFIPSSPIRRDASADYQLHDAAAGGPDSGNPNTPRLVKGSKLRQELSVETGASSGWLPDVSSPLNTATPSRTHVLSDSGDAGRHSPAPSRSSTLDPDNLPMPMPRRRPRTQPPLHRTQKNDPTPVPLKKDSRPKPYVVEIPSAAPRCPPPHKQDKAPRDPFSKSLYSGFVDFHPWTGKHHEDEWSSEGIQKGIWDRGSQSETSSARVAIYTPLRQQKSGLTALSQLFMTVMNQRRAKGQVTAASTFKPPPRVTLTDTKREVWMKELANPAVSLRRLSRTIPHGIRGRTLLDQCLNKNVPTERAVWLVKCVGANEIRAVKRKGVNGAFIMGGELKWIREWTVLVEAFVESVVSSYTDSDWKAKVVYAIRLATYLYNDQLLERDHYLDWVLTNLESSSQARIPLWLLVVQNYQHDIMRMRKSGRRLAFVLCMHLNTISNDPDRDIVMQLSDKIAGLLSTLLKLYPESFVNPLNWFKYRHMLRTFFAPAEQNSHASYHHVEARNNKLSMSNTTTAPMGRQQLVAALDAALRDSDHDLLASRCWDTMEDKDEVVRTAIQWATSLHRPGSVKVLVAAKLIRSWTSTLGAAVTSQILLELDCIPASNAVRKELMYHLVSELVRSGHFSMPRYLQWLIARGGYHDASEIDRVVGLCGMRLLVELPLDFVSEKWRRERANLLRRAGGYSTTEEQLDTSNALKCVAHALGMPGSPEDPIFQRKPMSVPRLLLRLSKSSRGLRSAVAAYLRDMIVNQADASKDPFLLPMALFSNIRTILESLDEYPMLSEVLLACRQASDVDLLASCVDTINYNLPTLQATDTGDQLLDAYMDRLRILQTEQPLLARPLLSALAHLATRLPKRQTLASELQHQLLQSDRTHPIDACSPVSDNMVTQMHTAESEVSEEIEKLFGSGNIIDQPTMNRLFRTMIPKLDAGWRKLNETRRVFASLLQRLRVYDTKHFDKLMADWISHIRTLKSRPALSELYPLLVSLGCLPMATLLQTAAPTPSGQGDLATPTPDEDTPANATYLQDLLRLLLLDLTAPSVLTAEETYRFGVHQRSAPLEHSKGLLNLIRNAIAEYAVASGPDLKSPLSDESLRKQILEVLQSLVIADADAVSNALSIKTLPAAATALVCNLTNSLLKPDNEEDANPSFDDVLGLANELTMPFCQLKLNMDLSMEQPSSSPFAADEPQAMSRFDLFAKAMDRAIEADNISWTRMLPCLSNDITLHLKNQAYERFLAMLPSMKSQDVVSDAISGERIRMAENLLGVLGVIVSGQPPPNTAQLTQTMVEKLSDLWEIVAARDESLNRAQVIVIESWLPKLLKFITLHSISASEAMPAPSATASTGKVPPPPAQEARARIIVALCGLLLDLESRPDYTALNTSQHIFDAATSLVDSLPDDLRVQCIKTILFTPGASPSPNLSSDPRLHYILSNPILSAADGLLLGRRRELPAQPHSSTARLFGNLYGCGPAMLDRFSPFLLKRWELLSEPTPNIGENDTSLSLSLFEAIKIQ